MSSSRVIKSGAYQDQSVADFCFNTFQKKPGHALHSVSDGFMPFFHEREARLPADDEHEHGDEASSLEEENEIYGLIRISEEELQRKIQEAFDKGTEEERKKADEDLAGICSALSEAISVVSRLRERIVRARRYGDSPSSMILSFLSILRITR